tara:strand:- start:514 stop:990 length:477 start_codon:yes stop_codon:yes gene_type:complete
MKFKKNNTNYFCFWLVLLGVFGYIKTSSLEELDIKFIPNCGKTRGGVAIADPPNKVYYCAQRINKIEWNFPNTTDFFFLHEIKHLEYNTGDEKLVDCLAAEELKQYNNGDKIIEQVIKFIESRPFVDEKYGGSGKIRSSIISGCYEKGLKFLETIVNQ